MVSLELLALFLWLLDITFLMKPNRKNKPFADNFKLGIPWFLFPKLNKLEQNGFSQNNPALGYLSKESLKAKD